MNLKTLSASPCVAALGATIPEAYARLFGSTSRARTLASTWASASPERFKSCLVCSFSSVGFGARPQSKAFRLCDKPRQWRPGVMTFSARFLRGRGKAPEDAPLWTRSPTALGEKRHVIPTPRDGESAAGGGRGHERPGTFAPLAFLLPKRRYSCYVLIPRGAERRAGGIVGPKIWMRGKFGCFPV